MTQFTGEQPKIAAIASDTHAVETRPNPIDHIRQPWHWVTLPNMGVTIGVLIR